MEVFLKNTALLDFDNKELSKYALTIAEDAGNPKEKAIAIYEKIRDGWRYNAYNTSLSKEDFKASNIFKRKEAHCVDKAILLTACLRKNNIPARIRFAKVKNHIATEKFEAYMGTNIMVPHGIVELLLNNKWIKVVPAFNKTLCEKLNVEVLEFDGENDAIFQSYDKDKNLFMEYIEDYGHFDDVPHQLFVELLQVNYPKLFEEGMDFKKLGLNLKKN